MTMYKERADTQRDARTNMFVMATVYAGTESAPVKIRNMSTRGALIEGGVIPAPASKVSLRRGALSIAGEIVWRNGSRAGLKFSSIASVAHWLPKGQAPQRQVDTIFQELKACGGPKAPLMAAWPVAVSTVEINDVKNLLEALAEELAEDADVVGRHASRLQSLDLATQILAKLVAERGSAIACHEQ